MKKKQHLNNKQTKSWGGLYLKQPMVLQVPCSQNFWKDQTQIVRLLYLINAFKKIYACNYFSVISSFANTLKR